MLFILCFHETTNNYVKECNKKMNKSKKERHAAAVCQLL